MASDLYLISMIDDATSRLFARFVRHDSSEENRRLLGAYLERFGRPLAFYTDKAGMFQVAVKTKRQEQREGRDRPQMPPTQIARALRELNVVWIPAHSPQAKGRVERQFSTAQDRLVKGMRVAGVRTIEEANAYLEKRISAVVEPALAVKPADPADAHRPLGKEHDLAAILSHVEQRQVTNDYTVRYDGKLYQIDRRDIRTGMRKAWVRVEQRLDGTIAVQFQGRAMCGCAAAPRRCPNGVVSDYARPNRSASNGQAQTQKRLDEELFRPLAAVLLARLSRMPDARSRAPGAAAKSNRSAGQNRPGDLRALSIRRPLLGSSTKADLSIKTKTPRTGILWPGLTGGLAPSASEPAPSQRSSDLPQGARLPRNIDSTLTPPLQPALSKQDISTLLGIGHFYFALTGYLRAPP